MIRKFLKLSLFVVLTIAGAGVALPACADDSSAQIEQAEQYLRGLKTMKADFVQTSYNGARLSGTFYLNRPGKLRFEYNEVDDFIVADGLFIYFYDAELKEQTNAPIGQTLADFLLRDNISLKGDVSVTDISHKDDYKVLTIAETDDEAAGRVRLYFKEEPYRLDKWQVIDAAGMTTEIQLSNMTDMTDFPPSLFAFIKPKDDNPRFNQ